MISSAQAQPAPLPAHFENTNEFAFWEDLARKIVVKAPMHSPNEPVEVVRVTPPYRRAEETVAGVTYKRAFEVYGNPLPDITSICELKGIDLYLGGMVAVIYLASVLVHRSNEQGYLVGSRGSVGSALCPT